MNRASTMKTMKRGGRHDRRGQARDDANGGGGNANKIREEIEAEVERARVEVSSRPRG